MYQGEDLRNIDRDNEQIKTEIRERKDKVNAMCSFNKRELFFFIDNNLFTLCCQEMLDVCENADKPKRKFGMISITVYYYFFFFSIHLV